MIGFLEDSIDVVGFYLIMGFLEVFFFVNGYSRKMFCILYWDLNSYSRWVDIDVLKCMLGR